MRSLFPYRQAALALLALSPLAYVGSMYLERLLPHRADAAASISREEGIEAAKRFAEAHGIQARNWRGSVGLGKNKNLGIVMRSSIDAPILDRLGSPSQLQVLLEAPEGGHWFRATVTTKGRVVSWHRNDPDHPPDISDEAARQIAIAAIDDLLGPGPAFQLEKEKLTAGGRSKNNRFFSWTAAVPGVNGATAQFEIQVVGATVTTVVNNVRFKGEFLSQLRPGQKLLSALAIASAVYIFLMSIFAVVRFVRRASEKEVSYRRMLLISGGFLLFSMVLFLDPGYLAAQNNSGPPRLSEAVLIAVFMGLAFAFVGAFLGITYVAGEGGLRETYPSKLTSLDALLCGHPFSSNVARSILAGAGLAGWFLLVRNILLLVSGAGPLGSDHEILTGNFYSFPLIVLFWDRAWDSLLLTTFGLLLPVALLRPRIRREWLYYGLVIVLSALCAFVITTDEFSVRRFVVSCAAMTAATILPFFFGDLLAVTACVFFVRFAGALIQHSAVSAQWWHTTVWVASIGTVYLLVELYLVRRGRTVTESEVRPLYARFLAEHLSMQAEIGAARQAQLRLLPDSPPRISGLTLAGSLVPSREVGGDFFDFYPLDDHRVGVLLAEGGKGELGSAMTIALAKGYLLHTTRQETNPVEILRRLRRILGATLGGENASVSVLYAVFDTRVATVRFARTGATPRLVINGIEAPEEIATREDEADIRHGAAPLKPQDAVVIYTDGLAAQISKSTRDSTDRFLAKAAEQTRGGSAADLHAVILKAAIRRKKEQPPDDVTAVVIRLETIERTMEVVA